MLRISVVPDGESGMEIIASRHGLDSSLSVGDKVKVSFSTENGVLVER